MNTLLRSTLLAAIFVLPTAAFAQPVTQVDETQVEMVAYEVVGLDSVPAQPHANTVSDHAGVQPAALSDNKFNPAAEVGLNSIYLRH